jgi:hypothetical protein
VAVLGECVLVDTHGIGIPSGSWIRLHQRKYERTHHEAIVADGIDARHPHRTLCDGRTRVEWANAFHEKTNDTTGKQGPRSIVVRSVQYTVS